MPNASNVALATVASFMALLHVGCASLISGGALLDYATTEQGARIDARGATVCETWRLSSTA